MSKRGKIRAYSKNLPLVLKTDQKGKAILCRRSMLGEALLNRGMKSIKVKGKEVAIISSKYYMAMVSDYIDHEKEMMRLLKSHGWGAVDAYVQAIMNLPVEEKRKGKDFHEKKSPQAKSVRRRRPSFKERVLGFLRAVVSMVKAWGRKK